MRPEKAPEILGDHLNSDDEDIREAAYEALEMAESYEKFRSEEEGEEEDEEGWEEEEGEEEDEDF
jgi:hypothetical protein